VPWRPSSGPRRLRRRTGTLIAGCGSTAKRAAHASALARPAPPSPATGPRPQLPAATTDPAVIAARATVPVLCWHQLRDWQPTDTGYARRLLICPPAAFRAQLDALVRAGYSTITPDDYLAHLRTGTKLPTRPVLLSFDDSQASQISEGLPQLGRRSMTATFFVMTVVLGKTGWMSRTDLRRLDDHGMTVAAHTWDHHRADRIHPGGLPGAVRPAPRAARARAAQAGPPLRLPLRRLEQPRLAPLRAAGYDTAFQLADTAMDVHAPLYTLRRILVGSNWTGPELLAQLRTSPTQRDPLTSQPASACPGASADGGMRGAAEHAGRQSPRAPPSRLWLGLWRAGGNCGWFSTPDVTSCGELLRAPRSKPTRSQPSLPRCLAPVLRGSDAGKVGVEPARRRARADRHRTGPRRAAPQGRQEGRCRQPARPRRVRAA